MQILKTILLISFIFTTSNVQAETNTGDTAWILTSSSLVLFMTLPGLALFYAGLVCSRNVLSVLSQHFAIACLMSILGVVVGYFFAFSGDGTGLIGNLDKMFLKIENESNVGGIPEFLFAMFQMTLPLLLLP